MADLKLLEGVLEGTQVPHQPLLIVSDSPTFSGLSLFRELLRRADQSNGSAILVSVLHPASTLLPSASSSTKVIDLSASVAGYTDSETPIESIEKGIVDEYTRLTSGQLFIDALDVLAEDYTPSGALRLFRSLLNQVRRNKSPSRIVLLLPSQSSLLPVLLPPTISPTLTHLVPHPPPLLTHLSQLYLTPIEASPRYWQILETAHSRRMAEDLAYKGEAGLEVGSNMGYGEMVVQVLVRKAGGGIKGISRSIEGLVANSSSSGGLGWTVKPVSSLINTNPIIPTSAPVQGQAATSLRPAQNPHELDLPFNLHLTDEQKRKRMGVPLPYQHEGEGAAVDLEFEDEEDEDDEEI